MRVATYNMENFDRHDLGQERAARLGDVIGRLAADILCLQEVSARAPSPQRDMAHLDALIEGLPCASFARAATHSDAGDWPRDIHNLVVLSRFPIRKVTQVHHDLVPAGRYRFLTGASGPEQTLTWDRPALHVQVDTPLGLLHVINVHLHAPLASLVPGQKRGPFSWQRCDAWAEGFALSAGKRNGQALEVRLLVDRILDVSREANIVICGDFNAADREVPVATIRGSIDDTNNPDLAARALFEVEAAIPKSRRYTVRHAGRSLMPDHILVSRVLSERLSGAGILNAELADEHPDFRDPSRTVASFHAPLYADFST